MGPNPAAGNLKKDMTITISPEDVKKAIGMWLNTQFHYKVEVTSVFLPSGGDHCDVTFGRVPPKPRAKKEHAEEI